MIVIQIILGWWEIIKWHYEDKCILQMSDWSEIAQNPRVRYNWIYDNR
jgi:hypothetical protein